MFKYSIIVPVYNVEKYLIKCLDSLVNQTYQNFEAIIVCDKCDDRSEEIVNRYVQNNENFKKIYAEKTGLAKARNIGLGCVKGDYILFLDSDDYYMNNLLRVLNEELVEKPDVLRFQVREISSGGQTDYMETSFPSLAGNAAFEIISGYHYVENSWSYVYKTSFWQKNNFRFMENCIAEDYGLTPIIIAKAETVKSISYIGYNYVQRENSLMNNDDYLKRIKKMDDMLKQAKYMKSVLKRMTQVDSFIAFINNSLIYYSTTLNRKDYIKYKKILKENNCFSHLDKGQSFKQNVKYAIIKLSPWFFYHHLAR